MADDSARPDEAGARDPNSLEREIERTRVDLARTIDSIADRVAPRNVARRGAERVKEQAGQLADTVSDLFRSGGVVRGETQRDDPETGIADDIVSTDYLVHRPIVPPPVLIGGAVAVVAITTIVIVRRRRRR